MLEIAFVLRGLSGGAQSAGLRTPTPAMSRGMVAPIGVDSEADAGVGGGAGTAAAEAELLRRAAAGDAGAFRDLTQRHLKGIVAIARRMLRDDAEAEDVAQEAFLRLWRTGATLDIGPAGVRPWLRRVTSNLCIDRARGRARLQPTDELPETPDPPTQLTTLEGRETRQRVDEALKRLPDRQRLALTLFHYEGMSQVEIGGVMGISDEAVESLLSRARRQLKSDLRSEWRALIGANGN